MIEIQSLSKSFGRHRAVDDVTLRVRPGAVTGLLGPNGAGKSTLMRLIVGLDRPTSGTVTIDGRAYRDLDRPITVVGAHLGGTPWQRGRSARAHLRAVARAGGVSTHRVDRVLDMAGIADVAGRRAHTFSLGMGQRLGLATALLGDPSVIILDEPVNGLDTDGVQWIRSLLRRLADEGRAVLVSSHLLSEMERVADQVVVLGRGRLLADVPTTQLARGARAEVTLVVAATDRDVVMGAWPEARVEPGHDATVRITLTGTTESEVGMVAHRLDVPVLHLSSGAADLETGYAALVSDQRDYVTDEGNRHVA